LPRLPRSILMSSRPIEDPKPLSCLDPDACRLQALDVVDAALQEQQALATWMSPAALPDDVASVAEYARVVDRWALLAAGSSSGRSRPSNPALLHTGAACFCLCSAHCRAASRFAAGGMRLG